MRTDKVFSLPIVPLANMAAILPDTLGIALAGRSTEQVAHDLAYIQPLDLHVDRTRHVRTERWLRVRNMYLVASLQHFCVVELLTARTGPPCHSDTDTCRDARSN